MKCVVCDTDEDHDDDDDEDDDHDDDDDEDDDHDDDDLVEMLVDICFIFQAWLASTPQICFRLLLGFSSPPALLSKKNYPFFAQFPSQRQFGIFWLAISLLP